MADIYNDDFLKSLVTNPVLVLRQLFRSYKTTRMVQRGSVVNFYYVGQRVNYTIHDPAPMVIITDIFSDAIRGVNLHYLTMPYVRSIISGPMAGNPNFSYRDIMGDILLRDSFRTYKKVGISQIRLMDLDFLKLILSVGRAVDVGDIDAIRAQIRQAMGGQNGIY